jgi:hypothetical protein
MNKEDAIAYLNRKRKIGNPIKESEYSESDKKEIEKVMRHGRVYGDPIFEEFQ